MKTELQERIDQQLQWAATYPANGRHTSPEPWDILLHNAAARIAELEAINEGLLAALRVVLDNVDYTTNAKEAIVYARAAIEKATAKGN